MDGIDGMGGALTGAMGLDRREMFRRLAVLGGGAVLLGTTGVAAAVTGPAPKVRTRKEIHGLTGKGDDLEVYREGVRLMRERSRVNPLDPYGWNIHAATHSIFCATYSFQLQVHYGWFFLPWHRAYMLVLEEKLRVVTGVADFAMPYWDWTRNPVIPASFYGEDNPLNDTTRIYQGGESLPDELREVGPAMRGRQFHQFGGFDRKDPKRPQVEGTMEQGAHNNIHNFIGGALASFDGAGQDPLFQLHHGNIDRLWEAWKAASPDNRDPTDPEFLDYAFRFFGEDGIITYRVGDLLDTERLGYRFQSLDWQTVLTPETTPRYVDGTGKAITTVTLDDKTRAKVKLAAATPDRRVMLQFERVQLPIHPYCARVFLNQPDATAATPTTLSSYLGTFTVLPIVDARKGLETLVSMQMEVPAEAAARLARDGTAQVVLVPLELRGRAVPPQPLVIRDAGIVVDA